MLEAIPWRNAILTKITAVGTSGDYDTPAAAGADRWTGTRGIYVAEETVEAVSANRVDEIKQTRLEVPYEIGKLVVRGDTLAYTYDGANVQRQAGTITRVSLPGVRRVKILVENA